MRITSATHYIVIVSGKWELPGHVFTGLWNGRKWIGPGPGAEEFKTIEDARRAIKKVPFQDDFVGILTESKSTPEGWSMVGDDG